MTANAIPAEPGRFSIRLPRPLWFALATVVLLVIAIGLRIGLPLYRQHVAVREIQQLGGTIYRPFRFPFWLSSRGVQFEFLDEVEVVDLTGAKIEDADMHLIRDFPALTHLNLWGTAVTDRGLENVKNLTSLVELDVACTQVSDAGLIYLEGLTELKQLKLHRTRVTESGVARLKRALPELDVKR